MSYDDRKVTDLTKDTSRHRNGNAALGGSVNMCGDEWTGARIGASTRVWASGVWKFDHPEGDPTPLGGGTAVHLLSRPPRPTL